jgi:DNA/RNA-binding domain of Phe-tRNA-synthetase-like protein
MTQKEISVELSIDPELRRAAPNLALGVVCAAVQVREHDEQLWALITRRAEEILRTQDLETLPELPEIQALRRVFRATGKEPSRYRGSQESLFRRILQGKGLVAINTIVDINNLISLESAHSVGCYDLAQVHGSVTFRVGQPGESYPKIGKEVINVAGLPVFVDQDGPFGSPTRDSGRTRISLESTKILMVIISFAGSNRLDEFVQRAAELLRIHASADANTLRHFMVV